VNPSVYSIVALMFFILCTCENSEKRTGTFQSRQKETMVTIEQPVYRTFCDEYEFSGILAPSDKAKVTPLEAARIKNIYVTEGQSVKQGQTLATMDDGQLVATIARFQPLKAEYDRAHRLFASKAMSKATYEEIESKYLAMKREISQLEENTTIRAPIAGLVIGIHGSPGEIFFPAADNCDNSGFIVIAQINTIVLETAVPPQLLPAIQLGQSIIVQVPYSENTQQTGELTKIGQTANPETGMIPIGILIPNQEKTLIAGTRAHVTLPTNNTFPVLSISKKALHGSFVYIVKNHRAHLTPVTPGCTTKDFVEIREGLNKLDMVIRSSDKPVNDGDKVLIK